jgi:hypothetical protein
MSAAIVSASCGIAFQPISALALKTEAVFRRANMNAWKMAGLAQIAAGIL